VWCPNSKSFPQESWNYILDAYPGDEFVDYVGSDVYNGADRGTSNWTSFRREAVENYFIFSEFFPSKPILICEVSSRERHREENGDFQTKAEWIRDLSETLRFDMNNIVVLSWFDQYKKFKINSSDEARKAFMTHLWQNPYIRLSNNKIFPEPVNP
jgi:hypothetical protein